MVCKSDEKIKTDDIIFVGEPRIIENKYISFEILANAKMRKRAAFCPFGIGDHLRIFANYDPCQQGFSLVVRETYDGLSKPEHILSLWKEETELILGRFLSYIGRHRKEIAPFNAGKITKQG